jgi:DNA primase
MPGLFSTDTLERIRAASDIVDVVGSYLPLKRAGASFTALCPFHKEKTPSFHVNPHRQIFHCFGCHKGGDVFAFVREFENIDFPEAVRRLADRARIPLEYERGGADVLARSLKEKLLEIHEQITRRWQNALLQEESGQIARDYLAKREVNAEGITLFRLGYAPDKWDDTVNWATNKGYDLATIEKAGLILKKEESDRYYDRFRGRLMFPICDEQGRVIGFSGRALSGDEKTAKYVNSPETPIFLKSKIFFGLDKSKRALLEAGRAIVCEGQLDLITCFMAGVRNIVAPQGTAFTSDHARILKRYVEEVVLCFDSDEAGQNAAVRALDHLLAAGLAVRVAEIPSPHDPDSFIKSSGPAAFSELIERAEGFFDYYLNRLCATNAVTTDKGRLAVLSGMAEAVHKTSNVVLIDKYAQKTALRLGVSPEAVRTEFKKLARAKQSKSAQTPEQLEESVEAQPPPSALETGLLKILLLHEDLVEWTAKHLELDWLKHAVTRKIVELRFMAQLNQSWGNLAGFLAECEDEHARNLITSLATDERSVPNPKQQLADIVLRLRNQFIDRQVAASMQKANQAETTESEKMDLLRQQQELRAAKRQPLAEQARLAGA